VSRRVRWRDGRVACAGLQELQPLVPHSIQDGARRQYAEAGARQLDRQRQPVEAAADLGDHRQVLVAGLVVGMDGTGPLEEQLDRGGDRAVGPSGAEEGDHRGVGVGEQVQDSRDVAVAADEPGRWAR
jgi:hypothetical protein